MSSYYHNAHYDESLGQWIAKGKYDFDKFEATLTAHFKDGGLATTRVVAGVLEVSNATISEWLNVDGIYYKREFAALVAHLREIAAAKTDEWHRQSARGDLKDAQPTVLNRRAEHFLDLVPKSTVNDGQPTHSVNVAIIPSNDRLNEDAKDG